MAIDIRATVTCSLGTLISGSISDDYIQGSGLVKTRGSVEISALITPAIGTAVTFSYTKGGVTRSIPRKLRVMSSFADPFRRTTTVELGCKLTYLSDLKEAVDWTAFDDPQNAAYNEDDARIVTLPIYASSVMNKCLTELGITASSNPLTNKFSIAAFDFGAGYVSVLNDLLISESYCGYLDTNEVLQVFALDQDAGTGPVFTASDIVDLGPIGVGSLPGEAVTVSYSTLKLKAPDNTGDNTTRTLWEQEEEVSEVAYYYIAYDGGTAVYSGRDVTTSTTTYTDVPANERVSNVYFLYTGDTKNVVSKRVVEVTSPTIKGLGQLASAKLSNGASFAATETLASRTITNYTYDLAGELVRTETLEYEDQAFAAYRLGIPLIIGTDYVEVSGGLKLISRTINTDEKYGEFTKRVTSNYVWWPLSQVGQQAVAEAKDSFTTVAAVSSYVTDLLGAGLVHNATQINTTRLGLAGFEGRPSSTELTNGAYAKDGDPNNGWRTESQADLELAVGSATAQRRIELSMPYAPDDTFSGPTGGPFTAVASDAPAKANRYGRVQNRLLLGNRSGINLQLAPEKLPAAPYSPLYVQASGLTALYRANGTNWAFDSNGIVCSVDALFWAAVGGTGTFWFPVAPGIATLPAEPPIVDGAMNPSTTVLPYNETAIYDSLIRLTPVVSKFDYSLTLLTAAVSSIKIKTVVQKVIVGAAGTFNLTGQAALFASNRILGAAAGAFALAGQDALFSPAILTGEAGGFTVSGQTASFIKSISVLTGTQAPLLGATSAVSFTGWTRIQNATADDEFIQVSGWPFTFTLASTGYTSTFVGSNTYLTFGSGATDYSGLGASVPNLPKILFGSDDNSYQRVYTKADIAEDGSNVMRIRYEGQAATTGTPGSSNIIAEFAFYAARPNGDQWIELRVGSHNRTSGPFMIASATTSYASSTITANSSWVFVGNSTGTSWTLTSNRYIG